MADWENKIKNKLIDLEPIDISINVENTKCGIQVAIYISSIKFENLGLLKRHRLVNQALKDYIQVFHSLTLDCKAPSELSEAKR